MLSRQGIQTLTPEQWEALHAPFPPESLSNDNSRGFNLTSIKAAFVIERLNEVFGPCGIGWRYAHSPFEMLDIKNGNQEVTTEVAFQYRLNGIQDGESGCPPAEWCPLTHGWGWRERSPGNWSEPIFACGGNMVSKGSVPNTDARKSAVTDGLTKAASMLGVGHQVFKGQVRVGHQQPRQDNGNGHHPISYRNSVARQTTSSGNGKQPPTPPIKDDADATTFWSLYNRAAKPAGISRQDAQALVDSGNWAIACANLRVLIAKARQPAVAN